MGFQKQYFFLFTILVRVVVSTADNPIIIEDDPPAYLEHTLEYKGNFTADNPIIIEDDPGYFEHKLEYERFLMAVSQSKKENSNIRNLLKAFEQAYKENEIFLDMDDRLFFEVKLCLREKLDEYHKSILSRIDEFQKNGIDFLMFAYNNNSDLIDFYKLYMEQNSELEQTRDILIPRRIQDFEKYFETLEQRRADTMQALK